MASRTVRGNVKYTTVKCIGNNPEEINKLLSDDRRIIRYEKFDSKIRAYVNKEYKSTILGKLKSLDNFLVNSETLKEIVHDIQRIIKRFDIAKMETDELINKAKFAIKEQVPYYKQLIEEGNRELPEVDERLIENRELEEMTNMLILDVFDGNQHILDLHKKKEQEREKANKLEFIHKKIKASQENLNFLDELKVIVEKGQIFEIKENNLKFLNKFSAQSSLVKQNHSSENPLTQETLPDPQQQIIQIAEAIKNFEDLTENYLDLLELKESLSYGLNAINLNNKLWDARVVLRGEEAANPFLQSLREIFQKNVDGARALTEDLKVNERTVKYQKDMNTIIKNIGNLAVRYNSINLSGNISVSGGGTSVSNSLHVSKKNVDIENIEYSKQVYAAMEYQQTLERMLDDIDKEIERLAKAQAYHDDCLQKYEENKVLKERNKNKLDKELRGLNTGYKTLMNFCNNGELIYKDGAIGCLIGMLFRNINIKIKGFFITRSGSKMKQVEMKASDVYMIFLNKMKKKKRIENGCCTQFASAICAEGCIMNSNLKKIGQCDNFELEDFQEILLKTRILGCMRNTYGEKQKKIGELRSEEVADTIYLCTRNAIEILILWKMESCQINTTETKQRLISYENSAISSLQNNKYLDLSNQVRDNISYFT